MMTPTERYTAPPRTIEQFEFIAAMLKTAVNVDHSPDTGREGKNQECRRATHIFNGTVQNSNGFAMVPHFAES